MGIFQKLKVFIFALIIGGVIIVIGLGIMGYKVYQNEAKLNAIQTNIQNLTTYPNTISAVGIGTSTLGARLSIINNTSTGEDILRLYIGNDLDNPVWRWNDGGHAVVRTSLAISGDHNLFNIGGFSYMLGIQSDISPGRPAFVVKTNPGSEGVNRGPLILGLDWDNSETFVVQPEGKVGIGTSKPKANLHVIGSAKIEGDLIVTGTIYQNNDCKNIPEKIGDIKILEIIKNLIY